MVEHKSRVGTALMVMHVQPPLTDMVEDDSWIERIADAIGAARAADVLVIYVVVGYRAGYPEFPANDVRLQQLEPGQLFIRGSSDAVHEKVATRVGDIVVTTVRVSAFSGTDLEHILKSQNIDELVLTGISTGGVVLGTLVGALDRDFRVTVLSDACADANPSTHQALLDHFAAGAPWSASVIPTQSWIQQLA
ncbi:cysteine hydrolase family protein [Rhodococcus sp. NPDC127530]|uniref:cysteine hydrolase family protein n=1 Tax=unclassified Rhodococcus (in: high G+C Gram-positive bacteria) TaxID=192944 RepID=UPI00362C95C3